jgi:CRISPR/Cas system-associated exonuclease Cas4 (RecB family)
MTIYKLSPSDLTFPWDACKYCFYMKVKHNITVRGPFPGIFSRMANLTSAFYQGKPTMEISPDLDPGVVKYRERFVTSAPITLPGITSQCTIHGRFDAVIEFIDGSYGIVDYKTSDAKEEQVAFYSRQLTAYAYALENPAPGALHLSPISRMGLFVITPERFERNPADEMIFVNRTTWMDVPRDDAAFLALMEVVVALLDGPEPPEPSEECGLCAYREQMEDL